MISHYYVSVLLCWSVKKTPKVRPEMRGEEGFYFQWQQLLICTICASIVGRYDYSPAVLLNGVWWGNFWRVALKNVFEKQLPQQSPARYKHQEPFWTLGVLGQYICYQKYCYTLNGRTTLSCINMIEVYNVYNK